MEYIILVRAVNIVPMSKKPDRHAALLAKENIFQIWIIRNFPNHVSSRKQVSGRTEI